MLLCQCVCSACSDHERTYCMSARACTCTWEQNNHMNDVTESTRGFVVGPERWDFFFRVLPTPYGRPRGTQSTLYPLVYSVHVGLT